MVITRKRKYSLNLQFATFYYGSESDVLDGPELESKLLECNDRGKVDLKFEKGTYAGKTFRITIDTITYEGKFFDHDTDSLINRREQLTFSQYLKIRKPKKIVVKETIKLDFD
ncbi:MAG: hypothetical protein ACW96U_10065 [Candidatus Heimdallarchaeaceae archaeon]|jgi:hypothetical protein